MHVNLISYLYLVTNIDDKGIWNGIHSNPLAVFEDLQSWHVVLEEYCDDVRIGVYW